jgi:SAM-dependent methyltransferase
MYTGDKYYESNPTWHMEDSAWKAKHIIRILKRNQIVPSSVADLGCGAGEVLRQVGLMLGEATQLHGYDISPKAIEMAKEREGGNLLFFNEDILNKENAHYDLLLMIDVIEHLEDYFGFLRNVQSKGEYKVLHIPLDLSVLSVLLETPLLLSRESIGHIHFFSKLQAIQVLKDLGYEIIDYFFTKPILDLPHYTLKAKLSRVLMISIISRFSEDLSARIFGGFSLMVLTR